MLDVRNLTMKFGGLTAVSDLTFSAGKGDFLGIIGPNGAGKTTLMSLITGYHQPTSGEIAFEGKSLVKKRPYQISHLGIGRTFQVVRPFGEMTVEENVMTGALFSGQRVASLSEARKLTRVPMELTGLTAKLDLPAAALTLGEKKKLELARALSTEPRLLLLDEVMGGVTRDDIADLCEVLRRIHASGVTIIMIEHHVDVIMSLCKSVLVLNFGSKLFEGLPDEAISHPEVIESYFGTEVESH